MEDVIWTLQKGFNVVMPWALTCTWDLVNCYQETFSKAVLYLNVPRINCPRSDFRGVNGQQLLSGAEADVFLASHGRHSRYCSACHSICRDAHTECPTHEKWKGRGKSTELSPDFHMHLMAHVPSHHPHTNNNKYIFKFDGQENGSAGKSTYYKIWQPEFNSWIPCKGGGMKQFHDTFL